MSGEKAADKAPEKQVIFLVGNSRGAEHGQRRTVDAKRAADLVAAGLAKYPAAKQ